MPHSVSNKQLTTLELFYINCHLFLITVFSTIDHNHNNIELNVNLIDINVVKQ